MKFKYVQIVCSNANLEARKTFFPLITLTCVWCFKDGMLYSKYLIVHFVSGVDD